MESKVVRKKRTMGRRRPKSLFNNLPKELQTEIFDRLHVNDQSNAMCVSHSWRNLILTTTLPKEYPLQPLIGARYFPDPTIDLEQLFNWCSLVMCCTVKPRNLIDTCNGLLLFCHKEGQAVNIVHGIYHYYVMNPITEQCVAVMKPAGRTSGGYSYAALAYDPTESRFFKIVRFQGHRHINVFSSMTGLWTTLTICFPNYINVSSWIKKSIYLKGSIYRLSRSRRLLKIKVDPQENVLEQAEVITLHPDCLYDDSQWEVSVKGDKILLIISRGTKIACFELIECVTRNVSSYAWRMIHSKESELLLPFHTNGELLCFYPYHEAVYFKMGNVLCYYIYNSDSDGSTNVVVVGYDKIVYNYIRKCGHLLLECFAPFACCLDNDNPLFDGENQRQFWRIFVPHL